MNGHPAETPGDGAHRYTLRVYYEDTDAGGVVYHANYLRFAERARTEALRDIGAPHAEMTAGHGLIFMVRRVKVDYHAPARIDDSLVVVSESRAIRAASVEIRQTITRATAGTITRTDVTASPLAVLDVQLACVRMADGRPARIPARWQAALTAMSGRASKDWE